MELAFLLLGICAGIMSGLFGIGGGIIMVPSLSAFFGMGILNANATSLAAMLLPVGVLGVIAYYKAGFINVRNALWISLGLLSGSYFGAELAVTLDVKILSKLYAAILLYVAIGYLDIPKLLRKKSQNTSDNLLTPEAVEYHFWQFILLGIAAGVFAGLFGKGGGLIIVPMLVKFFRYENKAATATCDCVRTGRLPQLGVCRTYCLRHSGGCVFRNETGYQTQQRHFQKSLRPVSVGSGGVYGCEVYITTKQWT